MSAQNKGDNSFLGSGWGFPPHFNKSKRSVEMLTGEADIQSSLQILMTTSLGERFMRSKYGSRVPDMVFETMDSSQRAVLKQHVKDSIALYEPRITPIDIQIDMNSLEGRVEISVDYKVDATNSRRNFVFPFYILEGTEVSK